MPTQWSPEPLPMLPQRADQAAALTADSGGNWVIRARAVSWQLTPVPGSGYPRVRALTLGRLFRRLAAAATPSDRIEH